MHKVSISIFIFLFFYFSAIAQTQKYQLSRQDSALINIYEAKAIEYRTNNFKKQESDYYNKIAMIWWEHNHFLKAINNYEKSLIINRALGNENAIAMINSNLALIYADKGDYNKSLEYFEKTLNIRKIRKEKVGIIAARINMSVVLNNLKKYDSAIEHLSKALDVAREMNDPEQMRSCYGMLSETYEKAGNNKKSMYYFELYRDFNELVEGTKVKKAYKVAEEERLKKELAEKETAIKELEIIKKNYEIYTKEKELKTSESEKHNLLDTIRLKDLKIIYTKKEAELQKAESQKKLLEKKLQLRNTIFFTAFTLLFLLIAIFFYFLKRRSNLVLRNKNTEITQKNEEIEVQRQNIESLYKETSEAHESIKKSIDYAGIIQAAMINKTPKLSHFFPESFIFYKQTDAVGGDFYWYSKTKDKIIVAAIDCTGHGVPGAFLTVLGNNILNQIVNISKITDPSEILFQMDKSVKLALNQEKSNNKDGMDIALCSIDFKTNKINFAGANNPLLIIKNDEIELIKGSRYGIGGYSEMGYQRLKNNNKTDIMYPSKEVDIEKGMYIYLFSDGFQDQIGGENMKKLKSKNFYNLLKEYSKYSAKIQKEKLSDFFKKWKGDYGQVDDTVIIGIKL